MRKAQTATGKKPCMTVEAEILDWKDQIRLF